MRGPTRNESEGTVIETRQILEELQLKNVLATSATGAIFLAGDPQSGRDVVIKMVSCAVPGAEERVRSLFLEMVEAARSVTVQTMPRLRDHGLSPEGDGFLVMDQVEGQTLDTTDELTPFAAVNILLDVLSCVEDLARAGTAHLNLTPGNVFVTNAPAYDRAVVLGFGTSATLLHAGAGVPVPAQDPHLAPELVAGKMLPADQGWRSDLFSLGVIACGALGAEIEADGYERPRVKLPLAVKAALPEAEPLEEMLGQIMEPDPMLRGDSPSDLRDPLIRALPDPPGIEAVATSDTAAEEPAWDPNKTDPAIRAEALAAAPGPVPEPAAAEAIAGGEAPSAGTGDDGWPEVLFDDPELPPSLADHDDHEDTDVRNPVPEDVWVPQADGGDEPAAEIPPEAVAEKGGRRVSRTELALVSVVVVVLVAIVAFTWPTGGGNDELPVTSAVPAADDGASESLVPPPEDGNLFDDLLRVQQLVDAGDLAEARSELDRLDERVASSTSSDQRALYDSLVTAVAQAADRGAAIDDLRNGLAHGSIKMVRRGAAGLEGVPRMEIAEVSGLEDDLRRARRALGLHADLWQAYRDGDYPSAIGMAADLQEQLPGYSGAAELREQSAAALETRAEALIADHDYAGAVEVLRGLSRVWPGRPGTDKRIAWCGEQIELSRREESVIAGALAMGERGDPEAGLAALAAMDPAPRYRDDVADARSRLERRLAEMDAGAPSVELAADVELAFKKNATVTIPLRIEDDYRVEKVVIHARNEADDDYLQIPVTAAEDGFFHFTVAPELHGNKNVYFFVVAKDSSGNVGRLGSRDEPRKIQRRKWFKKLG